MCALRMQVFADCLQEVPIAVAVLARWLLQIILSPSHPFQTLPSFGKDQEPAQLLCIIPSRSVKSCSSFKARPLIHQAKRERLKDLSSSLSIFQYLVKGVCSLFSGVGKRPLALQLNLRNRFRKHGKRYMRKPACIIASCRPFKALETAN